VTTPEPTWTVGVVGAGTMGAGIAQVVATAGHRTLLLDAREGAAAAAVAGVEDRLRRSVERGRLDAAEAEAVLARLEAVGSTGSVADLAGCDLVVEAVVEDLAVKHALLADLEGVVSPSAVLASNTSSLPVDELAAPLAHPGRVAGLHFFNPAPLMRLVEVVRGARTDPAVVERLVELVRAWGKVPVTCASTPGFVVNRVARPYYGEAFRLLGSTDLAPATVDALLREAGGFPMGPLELTDLIGQDVNAAVGRSVWQATGKDPRYAPSPVQDALVAAGRLGRKTGSGFYEHGDGRELPQAATVAPTPGSPAWWPHPSVREPRHPRRPGQRRPGAARGSAGAPAHRRPHRRAGGGRQQPSHRPARPGPRPRWPAPASAPSPRPAAPPRRSARSPRPWPAPASPSPRCRTPPAWSSPGPPPPWSRPPRTPSRRASPRARTSTWRWSTGRGTPAGRWRGGSSSVRRGSPASWTPCTPPSRRAATASARRSGAARSWRWTRCPRTSASPSSRPAPAAGWSAAW
jgi:3-hydroxyacyl-CoA dehydrogenase